MLTFHYLCYLCYILLNVFELMNSAMLFSRKIIVVDPVFPLANLCLNLLLLIFGEFSILLRWTVQLIIFHLSWYSANLFPAWLCQTCLEFLVFFPIFRINLLLCTFAYVTCYYSIYIGYLLFLQCFIWCNS